MHPRHKMVARFLEWQCFEAESLYTISIRCYCIWRISSDIYHHCLVYLNTCMNFTGTKVSTAACYVLVCCCVSVAKRCPTSSPHPPKGNSGYTLLCAYIPSYFMYCGLLPDYVQQVNAPEDSVGIAVWYHSVKCHLLSLHYVFYCFSDKLFEHTCSR